jgi:C4-dicarboxylate-specific signal transduction histidine kinase
MADTAPTTREIIVAIDSPDSDDLRVAVKDRGTGIKEAVLAKLFRPFFTTREGGMGMGLAICRSTIEAQGGCLVARNREDGGAEFEFMLPGMAHGVERHEELIGGG